MIKRELFFQIHNDDANSTSTQAFNRGPNQYYAPNNTYSIQLDNLNADKKYIVYGYAENDAGTSDFSNTVPFIASNKPVAPSITSAVSGLDQKVTLYLSQNTTLSQNLNELKVYSSIDKVTWVLSKTNTTTPIVPTSIDVENSSNSPTTRLTNGVKYYFAIVVKDTDTVNSPAPRAQAGPFKFAVPARILTASDVSLGSASFNADNTASVNVVFANLPTFGPVTLDASLSDDSQQLWSTTMTKQASVFSGQGLTVTTASLTLALGKTYTWTVRIRDNHSPYSDVNLGDVDITKNLTVVRPGPPSAPQDVRAMIYTNASGAAAAVHGEWKAPQSDGKSALTKYMVGIFDAPNALSPLAGYIDVAVASGELPEYITISGFNLPTLNPFRNYYLGVKATNYATLESSLAFSSAFYFNNGVYTPLDPPSSYSANWTASTPESLIINLITPDFADADIQGGEIVIQRLNQEGTITSTSTTLSAGNSVSQSITVPCVAGFNNYKIFAQGFDMATRLLKMSTPVYVNKTVSARPTISNITFTPNSSSTNMTFNVAQNYATSLSVAAVVFPADEFSNASPVATLTPGSIVDGVQSYTATLNYQVGLQASYLIVATNDAGLTMVTNNL